MKLVMAVIRPERLQCVKDALKAAMGDAEELQAGEYKLTWRRISSVKLDVKGLRAALPDPDHQEVLRDRQPRGRKDIRHPRGAVDPHQDRGGVIVTVGELFPP